MPEFRTARQRPSGFSIVFRVGLLLACIAALNIAGMWIVDHVEFQVWPRNEPVVHLIVLGLLAVYVLLMTVPFMPGVEIGLGLMLMFDGGGIAIVYGSTLVALSTSFLIGSHIPASRLAAGLDWLYLRRAAGWLRRLEPLPPAERIALLTGKAPNRMVPFLLKHRYLLLGVAINLPGNAVLGGGGGIGMICGMSGLYSFPRYLGLLAVAILPVPILVLSGVLDLSE